MEVMQMKIVVLKMPGFLGGYSGVFSRSAKLFYLVESGMLHSLPYGRARMRKIRNVALRPHF